MFSFGILAIFFDAIAHFKFFYKEAYAESNKLISGLNTAVLKAIQLTEEKDFVEKNIEHFRNAMSDVSKIFEKFRKNIFQAMNIIPSYQEIVSSVFKQIKETCWIFDFSGIKHPLLKWPDTFQNSNYELSECIDEDIVKDDAENDGIDKNTANENGEIENA